MFSAPQSILLLRLRIILYHRQKHVDVIKKYSMQQYQYYQLKIIYYFDVI